MDPSNSYQPGSTVAFSCSVQGYPTPNVTWTKDGLPLVPSERVQISVRKYRHTDRPIDKCNLCFKLPLLGEPYRVIINNISTADSGRYGCMAANAVSYSFSEDKINVECKFHCENVLEVLRITISVPICICCSYHTFESRMY